MAWPPHGASRAMPGLAVDTPAELCGVLRPGWRGASQPAVRRVRVSTAAAVALPPAPAAAPAPACRPWRSRATICGPPGRRPVHAAAGRFGPRGLRPDAPCFERAGQHLGRSRRRPTSITSRSRTSQPAVRRPCGCPTTTRPSRSCSRTSSGCGPPTSSTTSRSTSDDVRFANGVIGKRHRLRHGGAAAGQDRGLRRLEEARAVQDRREAEGEGRSPSASTPSSIPGSCAASTASSATCMPRRATSSADVKPRDQGSDRRPEAGAPDLQHRRGAEGEDPGRRLRRQQGDQRRQAREAR